MASAAHTHLPLEKVREAENRFRELVWHTLLIRMPNLSEGLVEVVLFKG